MKKYSSHKTLRMNSVVERFNKTIYKKKLLNNILKDKSAKLDTRIKECIYFGSPRDKMRNFSNIRTCLDKQLDQMKQDQMIPFNDIEEPFDQLNGNQIMKNVQMEHEPQVTRSLRNKQQSRRYFSNKYVDVRNS
ncbi:hypothetical protein CR513_41019, partial [Mucuna pruriens]